ncbi:MAG: AI-2E family transporter [Clostridia bacterium]|nr:AI-2E family transporter [Clostridia bacterium]
MDFNSTKMKRLAKWIICIAAACILIYLAVANINVIGRSIAWVYRLLSPLILGFAFALILNVPMGFFERILWKNAKNRFLISIRRVVAFVISVVIILGILTGIVWLIIPELIDAFTVIGKGAIELAEELANIDKDSELYMFFDGLMVDIDWNSMIESIQKWLERSGSGMVNTAVTKVTTLLGGIFDFFIAIIFAVYILFSKKTLKRQFGRMIRAWLPETFAEWFIHACSVASGSFRSFVSGQTIEALILGTLCMLGMFILRIPYAPMVGALVGITALIPVVGAFIGVGVGAFMILTVDPLKALIFLIFIIVLQQIEGNLIYPKVMGSRVNLPAMWILAAVTVGGALAGPVGMLLGVPCVSTAYVLIREATQKREEKKKADELPEEENETINDKEQV